MGGGAAVVVFVAALLLLRGQAPALPPRSLDAPNRANTPTASSAPPAARDDVVTRPASPKPPGLHLGKVRGPAARAQAQEILDDSLAELRRLDDSHQHLARDVYMRGHSAAERVEDELDEGDEPGLAKLRADEDAMKAEMKRIYGVTGVTGVTAVTAVTDDP